MDKELLCCAFNFKASEEKSTAYEKSVLLPVVFISYFCKYVQGERFYEFLTQLTRKELI